MPPKQTELVDENIPHAEEKVLFLTSIQVARDKLKEAVLQCATISVARSLSNEAIQEINKAIAVYSIYMSTEADDPVPKFVDSVAIASIASRSVLNAFLAYAREKKPISVDQVGAIIYKQVTILDKLLDD